jgi:hypothetical protein
MTPEEYNNFRQGFMAYCQNALPETLSSVDELATEVTAIRWMIRQYVSRLEIPNKSMETEIDWQISQLTQRFDAFMTTYFHDEPLKEMVSQAKRDYQESLNLYRSNALYPIFKYPMSPQASWRYELFVKDQEERSTIHFGGYKEAIAQAKPKDKKRVTQLWNELAVSRKTPLIPVTVQIFVEAVSHAYGVIFPDEFHPEQMRVVQYHYLPNKSIKLTAFYF